MEHQELHARNYVPWLLGPVAVGTGLLAHLTSGGTLPWPPALLASTALLSMCASLLSRLPLPPWALLLLCGMAQQLLHLAFELFSVSPGTHPGRHGHTDSLPLGLPEAAGIPEHLQELMLVAHVAAALLTALTMAKSGRPTRWPRRLKQTSRR